MEVRRGWVLLAAVLGSAVVFLDGTIVNVALETIGNELPSSVVGRLEGLTYVTSGYLAVLAALLILAGAMGDTYGRRRIFGIGLTGFGITSVACGLAPTLELLVLARLLQGATGALLVPGAIAIITASFDGEARGRAFGTWAAATSAVTIFGPLVGGFLVQSVTWRAAFLINVPLVLLGLYALRHVPESKDDRAGGHLDWLGAAVIGIAVGGLSVGATRGQQAHWQDPVAWAALIIGTIALVAFPFLMLRRPHPLVPLALFKARTFSTINLSTFVIYGALYMTFTFQALFLQGTLGYTPLAAGLAGLPSGLLLVFVSRASGRYAARIGARPFLVIGPLLMAGGLCWLARIPADSQPWLATPNDPASLIPPASYFTDWLPAVLVFGLGLSLLVAPLTTALMSSVPTRNAGIASAINNAVSRVGAPLAGAVLFIVVSASFYPTLASLVPGLDVQDPAVQEAIQPLAPPGPHVPPNVAEAAREASTRSFHLAMLVSAGLLLTGSLVNGVGLSQRRLGRAQVGAVGSRRRRRRAGRSARAACLPRMSRTDDRAATADDPSTGAGPREWDAATYDRISDDLTAMGGTVVERLPLRGDETVLDAGCGSGRVTELLAERLPEGHVIALDGSAAMITQAEARLARFGGRVTYLVADLAAPLPVERPVDAVLSTATFHWILDHDALFTNLAAVLRPGGRLAAQCGGAGNIASVIAVLATVGDGWTGPTHFATEGQTAARLAVRGFSDISCWLAPEPVTLDSDEAFVTYLRTIVLGAHIARLPEADRDPFVRAVAARLPSRTLDYVRLNIDAVRA